MPLYLAKFVYLPFDLQYFATNSYFFTYNSNKTFPGILLFPLDKVKTPWVGRKALSSNLLVLMDGFLSFAFFEG
jgi:hypothetical protein